MASIGHIAAILAFIAASGSAIALLIGARVAHRWMPSIARYGILCTAALYTLALGIVLWAFATKDFSLRIVAEHASRDLPGVYTLSALYADKSGSLFFWGWLLAVFTAVVAFGALGAHRRAIPYALAILAATICFFLGLVTVAGNVFEKVPAPPSDGFGLNPLLQNLAMLFHPPFLYVGFAGFAVVFALMIAGLATRDYAIEAGALVRRWALFAWCALGIGNVLGMWWSYNELGWGGYWAWDPVENAGLMPWLLGTALLHALAMRRQRGRMHTWALALAVFTFVFTLLSPFVTHGGIESPLHGFYGSEFPRYILGAMLVTLIASLGLLYVRRGDFRNERRPYSLFSREGAFLTTDIVLTVLVCIILIGTVFPRVAALLGGAQVTVDRSFFDWVCGPILLVLVFLMGVCPLLGWGRSFWNSVKRNLVLPSVATAVAAVAVFVSGVGNWYGVAVAVCGLPFFTICLEWFRGTRARHRTTGRSHAHAFLSLINGNRGRYGGFLVHIGIILIALGVIASSFYGVEKTETLDIGQSMMLREYELTYEALDLKQDRKKASAVATVEARRDGHLVTVLQPQYDYWWRQNDHFAEVAVRTTAAEDLFVSLLWTSYDPDDRSATLRAMLNPLIVWIWVGGGLLFLGGAVSFSARTGDRPASRDES